MSDHSDDDEERIEREHENPDDASGEDDVEGVPDGDEDVDEETQEWLDEEQKNPDDRESDAE